MIYDNILGRVVLFQQNQQIFFIEILQGGEEFLFYRCVIEGPVSETQTYIGP